MVSFRRLPVSRRNGGHGCFVSILVDVGGGGLRVIEIGGVFLSVKKGGKRKEKFEKFEIVKLMYLAFFFFFVE